MLCICRGKFKHRTAESERLKKREKYRNFTKIRSDIKFVRVALHFATPENGTYGRLNPISRTFLLARVDKKRRLVAILHRERRRVSTKRVRGASLITRASTFASRCRTGSDEIHLSSSHVRCGKNLDARRTWACMARALGQSKIETRREVEGRGGETSRWCSRAARPLVESKRNKRATRARMQNNAPRRARPAPCRNPSPPVANRWIDPLWCSARVLASARAESRREAQLRHSRGKPKREQTVCMCMCVHRERGCRKRKEHRVVCVRVYVRGMRRTRSSVTEGTIKRYFRRGNSRYLKLRSQISNAENRC